MFVLFAVYGEKLPLAPLYLGSLYAPLNECVGNSNCSVDKYDVVTHVDTNFL